MPTGHKVKELTKEFLVKEYIENKRSCSDIARQLNCDKKCVSDALRNYGFEVRKMSGCKGENIIGRTFNYLTVVGHCTVTNLWICKCQCDNEIMVRKDCLKSGHTKSCGCLRIEKNKKLSKGYGGITGSFLSKLKSRSKWRGFDLTAKYLWGLFLKQRGRCALTDTELTLPKEDSKPKDYNASLDRIDSDLLYLKGNVQFVTKKCNCMKMDNTMEEIIEFGEKVYRKHVIDKNTSLEANKFWEFYFTRLGK